MKFSENWLRSLVNLKITQEELIQGLTMAGLEVESATPVGTGIEKVVVGEIVSTTPHPNANKLNICEVHIGEANPLSIVCGAANARAGLKAPLAKIGAKLPYGIEIKPVALRGIESQGMLCSAKELGLSEDSSGLMELPEDAIAGQPIETLLDLPDTIIELKLTPNRPDCLSISGLAAELKALFESPVKPIAITNKKIDSEQKLEVDILEPKDCPRYLGRIIEDINLETPSPLWLREKLRRSGIRPINVAVDCSHYVMLELGQPSHAFDLDKIEGGIVVRHALPNEKLKLLDERDINLPNQLLVVADHKKALALAGIMGGYDSRVTPQTRRVFIECAYFDPRAISGQARNLGLHTDASHRFERGVDPELPARAIARISQLLIDIAGGKAAPITTTEHPLFLPKRSTIKLRHARIERVLGVQITRPQVEAILQNLSMQCEATQEGWNVTAPSRRFDISIEEDLIEEVIRIHGYANLPCSLPQGRFSSCQLTEMRLGPRVFANALVERGYIECLNLSFVPEQTLKQWGLIEHQVKLLNPLSADLAVMRTSLLPGLIETLKYNLARQHERVRLFEIGRIFLAIDSKQTREVTKISGVISGAAMPEQWAVPRRKLDFFDLKGDIEQLLGLTTRKSDLSFIKPDLSYLHPGQSAQIYRNKTPIGVIGALHPELIKKLELPDSIYVFEIDLDAIDSKTIPSGKALSRFPSIRRDIAIIAQSDVPFDLILATIRANAGRLLKDLLLFDEYRGINLPKNSRSLAIGLILNDDSRTLTDTDADQVVNEVVLALRTQHQIELRSC
jgi:phenylalanyl-tRNA synthetase beta chain